MPTQATPQHAPIREAWLAQVSEEILDPGLPIVDAHHHLWDRPGARYLFEEPLADTRSGHDIRATVFVQCRSMVRGRGLRRFAPSERRSSSPASPRGAPAAFMAPCGPAPPSSPWRT
jgi:hypothetical protein